MIGGILPDLVGGVVVKWRTSMAHQDPEARFECYHNGFLFSRFKGLGTTSPVFLGPSQKLL